jgi:NhaP-type Na+/H+ or K+/H+ antiporter
MSGMLWVVGAATVLFAGVIGYGVTRRYGWGLAVMLPVLALMAMIGMRWQNAELSLAEGLDEVPSMLLFALPILLGVGIGILLARFRRG